MKNVNPGWSWWHTFVTYLNAASVRLEATCRVLSGDSTLNGTAIDADVLLPQAQVRQAPALRHMDLSMDQIYTANEEDTREGGE